LKRHLQSLLAACGLLAGALTGSHAYADTSIPVADFFKRSQYGAPVLSPDGKNMAVLTTRGEHLVLSVIDLDTRVPKVIAADPEWDVSAPMWLNNQRLVFSIAKGRKATAEEETGAGGLFAVDRDGANFRKLSSPVQEAIDGEFKHFRPMHVLKRAGGGSNDLIVQVQHRSRLPDIFDTDVYRLDTTTGRTTRLTFDNPGFVQSWTVDHNNVVRAATSMTVEAGTKRLVQTNYYRDDEKSPWKKLYSAYISEGKEMDVDGFDFDNKTMFVGGRFGGRDRQALYVWDFAKNAPGELIAEHPEADVSGGVVFDEERKVVVGVNINGMQDETYYFDEKYAKVDASLKAALPGYDIQFFLRGDRALVWASGPHDYSKIYLFDAKKNTLERVLPARPEFEGKRLSEQTIIHYKARDGLTIPAYLTLPEDRPAKNLPMIMYVHGGPHARDEKGYDPIVQMFASRGYAVLQPQFRMSTGFGWNHYHAGWRQWGMAMQDDLTDGVNALAAQGIIDKNRVCISGASYGGYAVMYGLIKDPDLYKCGVNFVGVTDIGLFFSVTYSDTYGAYMDDMIVRMHGDPKDPKQADYFHKTSAIENADRIKAPVLMAYGSEDVRVPMIHGEKIRDKLLAKGNVVQWKVMTGEGHGWHSEANNIAWGQQMLDFVERYIGKAK